MLSTDFTTIFVTVLAFQYLVSHEMCFILLDDCDVSMQIF